MINFIKGKIIIEIIKFTHPLLMDAIFYMDIFKKINL